MWLSGLPTQCPGEVRSLDTPLCICNKMQLHFCFDSAIDHIMETILFNTCKSCRKTQLKIPVILFFSFVLHIRIKQLLTVNFLAVKFHTQKLLFDGIRYSPSILLTLDYIIPAYQYILSKISRHTGGSLITYLCSNMYL